MKQQIKNVLVVMVGLAVLLVATAPFAKEDPPPPEKMKKLSFPDFKEFTLKNGLEALVVEHREQPTVSMYCIVKVGGSFDPDGKESLASFVIDQINKGTTTKDALELAKWIESVGGNVSVAEQGDYSFLAISILSEYIDVAYEYLADVMRNPVFPDDELEISRKQSKTGLEFELSDPAAMARRHTAKLIYGDHPYAKRPTVESVEAVTREDVVAFHKKNYVPNNVLIGVVGDVKWKDVKKAMEKHLGDWESGSPEVLDYVGAPEATKTKIFLYHRPGAVQTELRIAHLGPEAKNPDWPAIIVANRILGGGADARLFMNLREDKGWTYGAYSNFSREKDLGMFNARAAVRTEVTDSALVEAMGELKRIRSEMVTEDDLNNAKSYLIGNFPITIETPDQIAFQVGEYKLLGLGKEELETYRSRLAEVTIEDVNRVMNEYLHPDAAYVVLVGDATEIHDKVAAVVDDVALFDIAGEPMSLESMAVEPVEYEYDMSQLSDRKVTYALTAQGMAIGDMNVSLTRKGVEGEDVFVVSSNMTGMVTMEETMEFRARDLSPVAFKSSLQLGPRTMGAEFAFTENSGSGVVQGMESPEPKEVAFELVEGTIMDGAVEFAIVCLPMEVSKKYRFPVVDSQSGTLQNVHVEIMEEVEVETPAGNFMSYKVKVKRPDGEAYLYFGKDNRMMVKQEIPSQSLTFELKSFAN